MKIDISASGFELTPGIREYAEEKIGSLGRLVGRFESEGEVGAWVMLSKTTRHHKHGELFRAVADLRLPHKVLRAEDEAEELHISIDRVKDRLRQEIEKYRTKYSEPERSASKERGSPSLEDFGGRSKNK